MSVWVNEVNEEGVDGAPGLASAVGGLGLLDSVVGAGVGAEVGSSRTGACSDAWGKVWTRLLDIVATLVGSLSVFARERMETVAVWLVMEYLICTPTTVAAGGCCCCCCCCCNCRRSRRVTAAVVPLLYRSTV